MYDHTQIFWTLLILRVFKYGSRVAYFIKLYYTDVGVRING